MRWGILWLLLLGLITGSGLVLNPHVRYVCSKPIVSAPGTSHPDYIVCHYVWSR